MYLKFQIPYSELQIHTLNTLFGITNMLLGIPNKYLDRTSDLRLNNELAFVLFKKGFNKDISPAIIKQTVILCYEFSGQAFQSGVSFEQLL